MISMEVNDVHVDDGRPRRRTRAKCRVYCRVFLAHLFSHVGLCTVVVGYAVIGAFAFEALEAEHELVTRAQVQKRREKCIQDMWTLTLQLNVLYEMNWTTLMHKELRKFERSVVAAVQNKDYDDQSSDGNKEEEEEEDTENAWSFSGALLYSVTVITTIGYGNIAPKTPSGKLVTIVYALFGIPLMLLCLTNIGDLFAHGFKFAYSRLCCVLCRNDDNVNTNVINRRSRHGRHNSAGRPGSRPFRDGSVKYVTGAAATTLAITAQPIKQSIDAPVVDGSQMETKLSLPSTNQKQTPIPTELEQVESVQRYGEPSATTTTTAMTTTTTTTTMVGLSATAVGGSSSQSSSSTRVPITMVLAFVSGYICLGAAIFSAWEKWTFLNGAYFCFITLSTIGFGDLVPGTNSILDTRSDSGQARLIICCVYLILGLAIIAMSFNLVQEEVTAKCKQIGRNLGILDNDSDSDGDD